MASGMNSFLGSRHNVSASVPTTNLQGGAGYTLTLDEKAHQVFTMGLINGNFYTSNIEEVVKVARSSMEEFLAKMPERATLHAIYAAEELGMKLFPTIWLVYLSTLEDKTLFKKAFPRIIGKNVKLVHDFMTLARKGGIRRGHYKSGPNGMGQSLKKTINKWAYENMNAYNVTRFTGKLEDVLRLTRPEDKNDEITAYLQYIFKPKDAARRLTFPRAQALENVVNNLNAGIVNTVTLSLIGENNLQLEELKHTFGKLSADQKKAVFMYMVPGLRYAALVSNLATIERAFATDTRKEIRYRDNGQRFTATVVTSTDMPRELINSVANKLRSFKDYRASKMLFFGLLTAQEMIITREWREAIEEVLAQAGKEAFSDLGPGVRVLASADTSGSMGTGVTTSLTARDIASYLTAAIAMSVPGSKAYATATSTKQVAMNSESLIQNAINIARTSVGYGTNFETLLNHYNGEKYVVLVTDGEQSDNMERKWASLTNRPTGAKLIVWRVAGFNYFDKISKRSDVVYLKGYSDTILRILNGILHDKIGQVDVVDSIKL